jgi:hypothetical protein
MKWQALVALIALIVTSLACNAGGDINIRQDDQYNYLTVSLTEQQVQDILSSILANAERIQVQNARIDLQLGQIIVTGDAIGQDGRSYPGNMTLQAGSANGALQITVIAFNFSGFNADQATIDRWNADIAAGLGRSAEQSESEVDSVSITDSAMSITWRSPR